MPHEILMMKNLCVQHGLPLPSAAPALVTAREARPLPPIESWRAAIENPQQEPPELVGGLIHRGTKVCLAGGSKSNKTWSLLHLALAVSLGLPWWGLTTTQGKAIYVNFEVHSVFLMKRVHSILQAMGTQAEPALDFWHLRGHACSAEVIIPKVIEQLKGGDYSLVILDPLYKLLGGRDENSAGDIGDLMNQFERIAVETGAAVVFGAHFAKGGQASKQAIDRMSGSGVFARDPDTIIPMTRHADEDAFVVEPILRNFPPIKPFVLRWEFPLMQPADDLDPGELKQAVGRRKNSRIVPSLDQFLEIFPDTEHGPGGGVLTPSQISAKFKELKWDSGALKTLREQALAAARIRIKVEAHNKQTYARPEVFDALDTARLNIITE
jgi:hypothetical protein